MGDTAYPLLPWDTATLWESTLACTCTALSISEATRKPDTWKPRPASIVKQRQRVAVAPLTVAG
jgi:hypothetical protein